jgi:4-hydroxy-3-polyprenylbenzoate decarboxylase
MEDYFMGSAIERIFLPLMKMQIPEIRDMAMPAEGVFHNLMLVRSANHTPGRPAK